MPGNVVITTGLATKPSADHPPPKMAEQHHQHQHPERSQRSVSRTPTRTSDRWRGILGAEREWER